MQPCIDSGSDFRRTPAYTPRCEAIRDCISREVDKDIGQGEIVEVPAYGMFRWRQDREGRVARDAVRQAAGETTRALARRVGSRGARRVSE